MKPVPWRTGTLIFVVSMLISGHVVAAGRFPQTSHPDYSQYETATAQIIEAVLNARRNSTYRRLSELCAMGHRFSGSEGLDRAIAWAVKTLKQDGHENVHTETVEVPFWIRGKESLVISEPRSDSLPLLGLGGSVATPPGGITAEVEAVRDEEELDNLGLQVRGKIVLFNNPMPPYDPKKGWDYGTAVRFRVHGARLAAEKGAVACLVRSVTSRPSRLPHAGALVYGDAEVRIPAAAISIEDAEMIAEMREREERVVATLSMEARTGGTRPSANVIAELRGSARPDEIVLLGAHLDSWDVSEGAHDNGTGCAMVMEALTTLRRLHLIPRRTIRVVLWTNEENGLSGALHYARTHAEELSRHVAAVEADSGGFAPRGFTIEMTDKRKQEMALRELEKMALLLSPLQAAEIRAGFSGSDILPLKEAGVPLLGFQTRGEKYYDYHHSASDTLDRVDPQELSQCVAALAVMTYLLADRTSRLGGNLSSPFF